MILRLIHTDSSVDFRRLVSENGGVLMLTDCPKDQGFALKQSATEAFSTAFEEILRINGMELLRARLVSRHAAVCQAMEDLVGVPETADSVLEWVGCLTQRDALAAISTKRRPAV
jgi:hypothetical protein